MEFEKKYKVTLCYKRSIGFRKKKKVIHPPQLELKREIITSSNALFLDLPVTTENKKFKTKLSDKWDAFPFSIVLVPHLDSNIPSNIFYTSIRPEILGVHKTALDVNTFITLAKLFLKRMKKQGSKHRSVISML